MTGNGRNLGANELPYSDRKYRERSAGKEGRANF